MYILMTTVGIVGWLVRRLMFYSYALGWAFQGYPEVGHCREGLGHHRDFGLGTAGCSCGWALRGYSVLGFAGILCRRSVVGHCRDYSAIGYSAVGHCTEGEENINCLTSNIPPYEGGNKKKPKEALAEDATRSRRQGRLGQRGHGSHQLIPAVPN